MDTSSKWQSQDAMYDDKEAIYEGCSINYGDPNKMVTNSENKTRWWLIEYLFDQHFCKSGYYDNRANTTTLLELILLNKEHPTQLALFLRLDCWLVLACFPIVE